VAKEAVLGLDPAAGHPMHRQVTTNPGQAYTANRKVTASALVARLAKTQWLEHPTLLELIQKRISPLIAQAIKTPAMKRVGMVHIIAGPQAAITTQPLLSQITVATTTVILRPADIEVSDDWGFSSNTLYEVFTYMGGSPYATSSSGSYNNTSSPQSKSYPQAPATQSSGDSDEGSSWLDWLQTGLDIVGFVPGPIGMVADLVNTGIHLARGNYAEAALSAVAIIPLLGDAAKAAKLGAKAVAVGAKVADAAKAVGKVADAAGAAGKATVGAVTKVGREVVQNAGRVVDSVATAGRKVVSTTKEVAGRVYCRVGTAITGTPMCFTAGHQVIVVSNPDEFFALNLDTLTGSNRTEFQECSDEEISALGDAATSIVLFAGIGAAGWLYLSPKKARRDDDIVEEEEAMEDLLSEGLIDDEIQPCSDELCTLLAGEAVSRNTSSSRLLPESVNIDSPPEITPTAPEENDWIPVPASAGHRSNAFTGACSPDHTIGADERERRARRCRPRPTAPGQSGSSHRWQRTSALAWVTICALLAGLALWPARAGWRAKTPAPGMPTRQVHSSPESLLEANRDNLSLKNIEDVRSGDFVLAFDENSGEIAPRQVLHAFHRVSKHLRILQVISSGQALNRIETTDEHPFWVLNRGFVNAGELEPGDKLVNHAGEVASVLSTSREDHPEGIPVFNFEVGDFHTYFVVGFSDSNFSVSTRLDSTILVHNAPCSPRTITLKMNPDWSDAQKAAARKKVAALNDADELKVTNNIKREGHNRERYSKSGGNVNKTEDVDHTVDLQLGGKDVTGNMNALDSSVNRSLGSQIHHQIKGLSPGTKIDKVVLVE
jgi:hypothetical protein